ncbi:NAD(P)-binding domain-containing protein [Pelobium sp.]|nr:NAD(P)-dependent oxidoreductase [Pelobium sp.]MDA9555452.1 NAD(P)-binding domain-containing protein [Pelobium sp.]
MKVVVYSVQPFEKEYLAKANSKKHDITLISNPLSDETTIYAEGKDAVIVYLTDDVSESVIQKLANYGVKYISTRSYVTNHIDKIAAKAAHIKLAHLPENYLYSLSEHALSLALALNTRLILSTQPKELILPMLKKDIKDYVVGIIGMGDLGEIAAKAFSGFGYQVIVHDLQHQEANAPFVGLDELYATADIISIHLPIGEQTVQFINQHSLAKMKDGVVLINGSRADLINIKDVLEALNTGKLSYLGLDVYDREFPNEEENHHFKINDDPYVIDLITHPNALVISYKEFLTSELLQNIAQETIKNLDLWQANKCVGKACACANACQTKKVNQQ